ncbi:MAG TPA: cysteine desulfurase [Nitrosopumilaceae archaeon]|nr:cysteine desulfurase [Nitrosopumilaceae archaeon]
MQTSTINIENIRRDFPILQRKVHNNKPLVYFDNAATTQKPIQVIDSIHNYYLNYNSNIHRAVHQLAEEATAAYELTRDKITKFINVKNREELIFVRGTTEAINLISYSWGRQNVQKDDLVVTTEYEHHSNIVPWQLLTKEKGAKLEYIGVDDNGELILDQLDDYLSTGRVKLVTFSHMSNVLGTITNAEEIIRRCHKHGVKVLIDAAQSVPHMKVDIQKLDCDFFAFSAHKMLGPTGVGVLWARKEILENMQPFNCGGDMIREVHKYVTTWNDLPYKFEAGTPNIADVIGFSAALDYLENIGMDKVREHETELTKYALEKLSTIKGIKLYGTSDMKKRGGVISFNLGDIHPHDLATILDEDGIAIRSGHHCAQVLMERLDVSATSRASFYIYNTKEEVDVFIRSLNRAKELFRI